jgi:hypothetical protein
MLIFPGICRQKGVVNADVSVDECIDQSHRIPDLNALFGPRESMLLPALKSTQYCDLLQDFWASSIEQLYDLIIDVSPHAPWSDKIHKLSSRTRWRHGSKPTPNPSFSTRSTTTIVLSLPKPNPTSHLFPWTQTFTHCDRTPPHCNSTYTFQNLCI